MAVYGNLQWAHQKVWRSTDTDDAGLYFKIKVIGWGNPPGGWGPGASVIFKKVGASRAAANTYGSIKQSEGTGSFIMGGYANDSDEEFDVSVRITGVKESEFEQGKRYNLVKFVVQTFSGSTAAGCATALSCKTYHKKAVVENATYTGRIGTDADPANQFWYSAGALQESWLKVDAACPPPQQMTDSIKNGCEKETEDNAIICPCDKGGAYPGSKKCSDNSPRCWPKWIYCDPKMPSTENPDFCGTGPIIPIKGDVIRIDKCKHKRDYRECYEVTDVANINPEGAITAAPKCNRDDGGCVRFASPPAGTSYCLALDHTQVARVGGPGTGCSNCTSYDDKIFYLSQFLARTLQDLGWAENIGGYTITQWQGAGVANDGTYQEFDVLRMTGYGHVTNTAFHIAGNGGSRHWEGERGFKTSKPFHINHSYWFYAVDASINSTAEYVERWRQQIEGQIKSAQAGQRCPPGATCEGGNVYTIVETWPPEFLELFVRETSTTSASVQVGLQLGKYFEFGLKFDATTVSTKEVGSTYPNTGSSANLQCSAWVTLDNLLAIAKKATGEGTWIESDQINVSIDFGGIGGTYTAENYKREFASKEHTSSQQWDTLFQTTSINASWTINTVNGWTIDVSGFAYSSGSGTEINPQVSISNIKITDNLIMTIDLSLAGECSLGLAYDKLVVDSKNLKVNVSAGITIDSGDNPDGRFHPSLGFFGSVGDTDPALSKILRGFEYDVNLLEGTLEIGKAVNLFDPKVSESGQRTMKCDFRLEAQTGHPDQEVFTIGGDFLYERTIKDWGGIWGKLVVRTEATFGFAIGSPNIGGLDPGPGGGAAGWCGIVWKNRFLEWLGVPFNVDIGLGIGFGAKFSFSSTSSAGKSAGSQGQAYLKMGFINWNVTKADTLRMHLYREHTSFLGYIPGIGKCLDDMPGLKRIGAIPKAFNLPGTGEESILRYLFRFHIVKSIAALNQAVKHWMDLVDSKEEDCENQFVGLYSAMTPGGPRHAVKYHWHQTPHPDLGLAGEPWGDEGWSVAVFHNKGKNGIKTHPTYGPHSRGPTPAVRADPNAQPPVIGKPAISGYCLPPKRRSLGNKKFDMSRWIVKGDFLERDRDGVKDVSTIWKHRYGKCCDKKAHGGAPYGSGAMKRARSAPHYYDNMKPLCFYTRHCYWNWLMRTNACIYIKQKYESIDKNINNLVFDFANHPALRGNGGLVRVIVEGIQDFIWTYVFEQCNGFNFTDCEDIKTFVQNFKPYFGAYAELDDQANSSNHFKNGQQGEGRHNEGDWEAFAERLQNDLAEKNCNWWTNALCPLLEWIQKFAQAGSGAVVDPKKWECPTCFPDEKFGGLCEECGPGSGSSGECEGCSESRQNLCQEAYFSWWKYAMIYQQSVAAWSALTMACQMKQTLCSTTPGQTWGVDDSMCPLGNTEGEPDPSSTRKPSTDPIKGAMIAKWQKLSSPAHTYLGLAPYGDNDGCDAKFLWTMYHEIIVNTKVSSALGNAEALISNVGFCSIAQGGTCFQCPVYEPTQESAKPFVTNVSRLLDNGKVGPGDGCLEAVEMCGLHLQLKPDKEREVVNFDGGEVPAQGIHEHWKLSEADAGVRGLQHYENGLGDKGRCECSKWGTYSWPGTPAESQWHTEPEDADVQGYGKYKNCSGSHAFFCHLCQQYRESNESWWPGTTVGHSIRSCMQYDVEFKLFDFRTWEWFEGHETNKEGLYTGGSEGEKYPARCGNWITPTVKSDPPPWWKFWRWLEKLRPATPDTPAFYPGQADGPYNKSKHIWAGPMVMLQQSYAGDAGFGGTTTNFSDAFCWQYHQAKVMLNEASNMYAMQGDRALVASAAFDWYWSSGGWLDQSDGVMVVGPPYLTVLGGKGMRKVYQHLYWACQDLDRSKCDDLGKPKTPDDAVAKKYEHEYDFRTCECDLMHLGQHMNYVAEQAEFVTHSAVAGDVTLGLAATMKFYNSILYAWKLWSTCNELSCWDANGAIKRMLTRCRWDLEYFLTLWRTLMARAFNVGRIRAAPPVDQHIDMTRLLKIEPNFMNTSGTQMKKFLDSGQAKAGFGLDNNLPEGMNRGIRTWRTSEAHNAKATNVFLLSFNLWDWQGHPKSGAIAAECTAIVDRATDLFDHVCPEGETCSAEGVVSQGLTNNIPWAVFLNGITLGDLDILLMDTTPNGCQEWQSTYDANHKLVDAGGPCGYGETIDIFNSTVRIPCEVPRQRRQALQNILLTYQGRTIPAVMNPHPPNAVTSTFIKLTYPAWNQVGQNRMGLIFAGCNGYIGCSTNAIGGIGGIPAGNAAGKLAGENGRLMKETNKHSSNNVNPNATGANPDPAAIPGSVNPLEYRRIMSQYEKHMRLGQQVGGPRLKLESLYNLNSTGGWKFVVMPGVNTSVGTAQRTSGGGIGITFSR